MSSEYDDDQDHVMTVDLTDLTEFNRQNMRRRGGGVVGIRNEISTVEKTDAIIRNIMASSGILSHFVWRCFYIITSRRERPCRD